MSFGVLTLNLWNISEPLEPRYRSLAAGLIKLKPDIVCLQEVFRDPKSGRSQAELVAEMCGLVHHVEKGGLAILCSQPWAQLNSAALPQFPGDPPRQVIVAELSIEGRPLLVINTHLAYRPEMIDERRKQVEVVIATIRRYDRSGEHYSKILCGDFNDVPDSPSVRAILKTDENFRDVFVECNPISPGITYSRQNRYVDPYGTIDQRIDYIFASGDLVPKNCYVVFDGTNDLDLVSDHFGVFGIMDFLSRDRIA